MSEGVLGVVGLALAPREYPASNDGAGVRANDLGQVLLVLVLENRGPVDLCAFRDAAGEIPINSLGVCLENCLEINHGSLSGLHCAVVAVVFFLPALVRDGL